MKILAVKADKIGSRIIRWGLDEPASHLAIAFKDCATVHSYLDKGVVEVSTKKVAAFYKCVAYVDMPVSDEMVFKDSLLSKVSGVKYDVPSFLYFGFCAARKKLLGVPFPKTNAFDSRGKFICTELLYAISETYAEMGGELILFDDKSLAITTPMEAVETMGRSLNVPVVRQGSGVIDLSLFLQA